MPKSLFAVEETAVEAAVNAHLQSVKDFWFVMILAPVEEAGDIWTGARRAEICSASWRRCWRDRIKNLYYLNTKLRKHKDLLRRFARTYRRVRDLMEGLNYIQAMNVTSRVQAYEVASFLELAKENGATDETLHLASARMQYRPLF